MINVFNDVKKVLIADTETPDKNGNTFTKNTLLRMKQTIEEEDIFGQLGTIGDSGGLDLTKATHRCFSPKLKDGKLYCKVEFLETPYVKEALGYLKEHSFELFSFRPEGEKEVDPLTDTIYDFKLNSINIFIESE